MGNDIFCFIPAKAASKRLKNKNTKKLVGKPMINYVIEAAKASKIFKDHIYVSTESENTAKIATEAGAIVPQLRNEKYAFDPYGISDVLVEFIKQNPSLKNFKFIGILTPTSPLILDKDIVEAFDKFKSNKFDSLLSVSETDHNAYRSLRIENDLLKPLYQDEILMKSQELEATYRINGAITIIETKTFLENKDFFVYPVGTYVMPKERSIDIDNQYDFFLAELILKNNLI
jgi:CMP-N-acetylneuraminic acid synthetase